MVISWNLSILSCWNWQKAFYFLKLTYTKVIFFLLFDLNLNFFDLKNWASASLCSQDL